MASESEGDISDQESEHNIKDYVSDGNHSNEEDENSSKVLTQESKAELNLTYSKFLLQHQLPFNLAAPLNNFTQQIASAYPQKALQSFKINRKIVTKAVKSISATIKDKIFDELKKSPFSISVDTSSDKYGKKIFSNLCSLFGRRKLQ